MSKESLFKYIRNEEVVLWAGAGLSLYAGYPSGKALGEIIIDNLTTEEKASINCNLSLPDLVEDFIRIKNGNKNNLFKILNKTFSDFQPISNEVHKKIASIPHFKTIITTNYDRLFESAYGGQASVAYNDKQIPYLDNSKAHIYKIHGDLVDPDSIILSKSDYNKFFVSDSIQDIIWTCVKEKFATKNILFIGYNLEDINISVLFEQISNLLKSHQKEVFLISPNLPKTKENELVRKGIHYVNMTGEEFVNELITNIKENILEDFNAKLISPDTLRKFLNFYNLLPDLSAHADSYRIQNIRSIDPDVKGKFNFKFKQDEHLRNWQDFLQGKNLNNFELSTENLEDGKITIQGIKLIDFKGLNKLILKPSAKTCKIDIQIKDGDGFYDIKTKIYNYPSVTIIILILNSGKITFRINQLDISDNKFDVNYRYEHNRFIKKVHDSLTFFKLVNSFARGKNFIIYSKNKKFLEKAFIPFKPMVDDSNFLLQHFENLLLIERHHNIKFGNIDTESITDSEYELVSNVVSIINTGQIISKGIPQLEMDLIEKTSINLLKNLNTIDKQDITFKNKKPELIELYGKKILLGYPNMTFFDCYVENLDDILNNITSTVVIKSRINKSIMAYKNELG